MHICICHLYKGIFHHLFTYITLFQFYSITSLVLFTEDNKLWNEGKKFFVCMAASVYHVIS